MQGEIGVFACVTLVQCSSLPVRSASLVPHRPQRRAADTCTYEQMCMFPRIGDGQKRGLSVLFIQRSVTRKRAECVPFAQPRPTATTLIILLLQQAARPQHPRHPEDLRVHVCAYTYKWSMEWCHCFCACNPRLSYVCECTNNPSLFLCCPRLLRAC
jgi:hypothetical protein